MSRSLALVAAALASSVVLGFGCGDEGETVVEERTPEQRGEQLFAEGTQLGRDGNLVTCSVCHASGDFTVEGLTGAPLARAGERPSYWGGQETDLLRAVNQCLYWFMGRAEPLVAGDPDGDDLFAFLASREGANGALAQPFTIGDVVWPGAGDAGRGEGIYVYACATCHGDKSTGDNALIPSAPVLPDETLAAHPDPEYDLEERRLVFVEKVRHGPFLGYGGTMPPFSLEVLPDADLADLLAYLGVP